MSEKKQSDVIASNIIWRLFERFGAQGVTFVVSIVLARILDPEVYGVVAIVNVIVTFLQVFIDCGIGNALIQKKNADDLDFSSVFYFNLVFCTFLYFVLFFSAPFIEKFFEMDLLTEMTRVVGLLLFISAFKNVQQAYVSRNMLFKKFFYSTLGGTIGAAIIGIITALNGFGAWALIIQLLFNNLVDTTILWITVKWRPKKMFSFTRLKSLFQYGWKILASGIITVVYNDVRQIIIGKIYTSEDLAFYNRGHQLPYYAVTNINSSVDSVLFPAMSNVQDNIEGLKQMTRRAIRVSGFIIWPMMFGMMACAVPFVKVVLTAKWLPCVPYIIIFCISYGFFPISTANLNAIKAVGRSDIFLKLDIIKKVVGVILILVSMQMGAFYIALFSLVGTAFGQIVNAFPNKKLLGYGYIDQLKDIIPYILSSATMGVIVYMVTLVGLSDFLTLIIQIPLGVLVYIGIAKLFKMDCLDYCLAIAKSLLHKVKRERT